MTSRISLFACCALLLTLIATGCLSKKATVEPLTYVAENMEQAAIFIEGRHRGFTPATVRIQRDLGDGEVRLRVKEQTVRYFEIEWNVSGSRSYMDYSYRGTVQQGMLTFNIAELPVVKDSIIVVPYYDQAVRVVDLQYGLDLIVTN